MRRTRHSRNWTSCSSSCAQGRDGWAEGAATGSSPTWAETAAWPSESYYAVALRLHVPLFSIRRWCASRVPNQLLLVHDDELRRTASSRAKKLQRTAGWPNAPTAVLRKWSCWPAMSKRRLISIASQAVRLTLPLTRRHSSLCERLYLICREHDVHRLIRSAKRV